MLETPRPIRDNEPKPLEVKRAVYSDGSVNAVVDKVGSEVDLTRTGHKYLGLDPASILCITTEHYVEEHGTTVRTDYVITGGGYGPGVILESVKGERGIKTGWVPHYNDEWIGSLASKPLVVGSRPGRFPNNAKLTSISAAMPMYSDEQPDKTGSNPISIALDVMEQHN